MALLVVFTACGFDNGSVPTSDGQPLPDTPPPDMVIMPSWEIDPVSGKGVPPTAAQWTSLIGTHKLSISEPDHVWLLQETSGTLADSIGAAPLTPLNVPSYGNSVAGWSRTAVGTTDTSANQGFLSTSVGNLNAASHLMLVYVAVLGAPAAERCLFGVGANTDHHYVAVTSSPVLRATGLGGIVPVSGTLDPGAVVHPIVLKVDKQSSIYAVYTDREKIAGQWRALNQNGGAVVIGNGAPAGAPPARYLYAAMWSGASAELSDAGVKSLLTSLGWTVTGY